MDEELEDIFAEDSQYDISDIDHPDYSQCICIYNDIIAYKDRLTGIWETCDVLEETRPETMEISFIFGKVKYITKEELLNIIPEENIFCELL